jgi:hypothetical protein
MYQHYICINIFYFVGNIGCRSNEKIHENHTLKDIELLILRAQIRYFQKVLIVSVISSNLRGDLCILSYILGGHLVVLVILQPHIIHV